MDKQDIALIEKLTQENQELAALWREHQQLDAQLDAMAQRTYLSPQDEQEVKRLKKVKLAGRDRIEQILAAYRQENPGA
ncbi:hypothetical protein AAU61_20260 [Desulfocarbo indianensis]|nr:hypothetical protein AAU61_20260 [Desulfocarbo indianensis]